MKSIFAFCLIISLLASTASAASLHPGLDDKLQFHFSAFNQETDAKIRSTRIGDPETKVDLGDLGLDDSEWIPQLGFRWRFGEKWSLFGLYSGLSTDGRAAIDTEFNFDGVTYPVNAEVKSSLDVDMYILAFDRTLRKDTRSELGLGFGIHAIDLEAGFSGTLNAIDIGHSQEDFLAPLPNIRAYYHYAFSDKLIGSLNLGYLPVDIDDYDGSIFIGTAALDYRLNDRWTLGTSYQTTDIDMDVDDDDESEDEYDVEFSGFTIHVTYSIP